MRLTAFLATIMLTGCPIAPIPTGPTQETVAVAQPSRLGPLGVRVKHVVEDSRCPAQVQCVWAGRLTIALIADDPAARANQGDGNAIATAVAQEAMLTLSEPGKAILGHRLALIAAQPEPVAGQKLAERDYRLTLRLD